MSCEQYSAGTNAEITLTEHTLPVGFCPSTWQDVLHAFIDATSGNLPGSYSTLVISATTPVPDDQDKLWLKVDTTTCHPEGFYLFFNGEWCRVDGAVLYGEDDSTTVGAMNVPTLEPNVSWLETLAAKQLFVIKANTGNTGAVTLQLPLGVAAMAVTKHGNIALEGYEILPEMLCLIAYDVAHGCYQLLNPRPTIPVLETLENPSFELDADNDSKPDLWVQANTSPAATGVIDTTHAVHGRNCFKAQVYAPGGGASQNGYETLTSLNAIKCDPLEVVYITWQLCADALAGVKTCYLKIIEFNNLGAQVATQTIWTHDLNALTDYPNPAGTWGKFGAIFVAGSTTTSYKIQIQVGSTAAAGKVAGWVYWDDFRIGLPDFPHNTLYAANTLTQNWTAPAGKYSARVTGNGAGGSGGSKYLAGNSGGGGGGAYAEAFLNVVPTTRYPVIVSAGAVGVSGGTGNNGGVASFNAAVAGVRIIATGGSGGISAGAGGAGGTGATGTVTLDGQAGGGGGADTRIGGAAAKLGPETQCDAAYTPTPRAGRNGAGGAGATSTGIAAPAGGTGGDAWLTVEWF